MPAADELDVDGMPAARHTPAELDRDVAIGIAVDEQDVDLGRLVDRRGRALLEQPLHRAGAGAELRRQRQVADRRLGEHSAHPHAVGGQQREMASGAVACQRHARGVDLRRECRRGGDDVVQRRRPLTAAVEPAVLDVPDGEAARSEVGGHAILEVAPVLRAPAASVHEHDARVRALAFGQPQVGDLLGMGP